MLLGLLSILALVAWLTITIDHPFIIASHSRALYVDEGFYSDGAQNFVKFGRWAFPFDFPHWAGSPFLTAVQTAAFSAFAPNLETARMVSVGLSVITAAAFYGLATMAARPALAVLITLAAVTTLNFTAHARAALADPAAVSMSLLALLACARLRPRALAIPISIGLALLAVAAKMYYVFTLAAVIGVWLVELLVLPPARRERVDRRSLAVLLLSLAAATAVVAVFVMRFGSSVSDYYQANTNKIPFLDPAYLAWSELEGLLALPYNTKADVFLMVVPGCLAAALVMATVPAGRAALAAGIRRLTRAEVVMCAWLVLGLLTIGLLQIHKPHYHLFAILPLVMAGIAGIRLVLPERYHAAALCAAALAHMAMQAPLYALWLDRPDPTAFYDASRDIAAHIHADTSADMVPVIGNYAAQLGLFSDRVFSLDARWALEYPLCQRVSHWKPRYHVNVQWPGSTASHELDPISGCRSVAGVEVVERYLVLPFRADELVLSRIEYHE